jgi:hypothetical protein
MSTVTFGLFPWRIFNPTDKSFYLEVNWYNKFVYESGVINYTNIIFTYPINKEYFCLQLPR